MTTIAHEALITLMEARCTLSSSDKWTKGCYARDKDGKEVSPIDPNACTYCLEGAMWHSVYSRSKINPQTYCPTFVGTYNASDVRNAAIGFCVEHLPKEKKAMYGDSSRVINFNDKVATYQQMIKVLNDGIADAGAEVAKEVFKVPAQ